MENRVDVDRRNFLASASALAALAVASCADKTAQRGFFRQGERQIGLQLYTLGDQVAEHLPRIFAELAEIGIVDLELPNLLGKTPVDLREAANSAGIQFSAIHLVPPPLALRGSLNFNSSEQEIVDVLGVLGVRNVVLPIAMPPSGFKVERGDNFRSKISRAFLEAGADIWKHNAAELNRKAHALAPHGIRVGYHNHNLEFAPVDGTTGWEILKTETDPSKVFFELDLAWIWAAGRDPAAEITNLGNRVRWLHLKDVKQGTQTNFALNMVPTQVGDGLLDWSAVLRAAQAAGVEHYYLEQEPPFSIERMDAVRRGHAFLAQIA